MASSVERVVRWATRWIRGMASRRGRYTEQVTERAMEPSSESLREAKAGGNDDACHLGVGLPHRVIDRPERDVDDAIVDATRNKPINEQNRDIVRINDFGALSGRSGHQIIFG